MARLFRGLGPFVSVLAVASTALAQPATETPAPAPTPVAPAEKPVATSGTVTTTSTTATTTTPAATTATGGDTGTDFSKIVKTVGIGYFGQFDVPLGNTGTRTVGTQLIGVRYFFSDRAGIDIGVGMGLVSGSDKRDGGTGTTTTVDRPSSFAMSFKAGVPIVMFSSQHYSFFFEPMAIFGFAGQTIKPTTPNTANTKHNGQRVFVGGNAGALIQFGFLGIPQLTLDATIGLGLDVQGGKTEAPTAVGSPLVTKSSFSQTAFGTLTSHQPWNIFHTNVAAIYHF